MRTHPVHPPGYDPALDGVRNCSLSPSPFVAGCPHYFPIVTHLTAWSENCIRQGIMWKSCLETTESKALNCQIRNSYCQRCGENYFTGEFIKLKLSKLLVAAMVMPYVTTDLNMRQILIATSKRGSSKKPKLKENLKQIQKQTSTLTSRKVINIKKTQELFKISTLWLNAVSAPRMSSKVLLANTK